MKNKHLIQALTLAMAVLTSSQSLAAVAIGTKVIALTGDGAPDGNGVLHTFGVPILNNAGQVAFFASLTGTNGGTNDDDGVFRGDSNAFVQIARAGQQSPDGNGYFSRFHNIPVINDIGQAAFSASLVNTTSGTTDDQGTYRGDGKVLVQIAREGQLAPDGNGRFFRSPIEYGLNDMGQQVFLGSLTGTNGGSSDTIGIFHGDGEHVIQIVRAGQVVSEGTLSNDLRSSGINNAGQVAVSASLLNVNFGTRIYRFDSPTMVTIAESGQTAPDGITQLTNVAFPAINETGQVAFRAALNNSPNNSPWWNNIGLFRSDGEQMVEIVRTGQTSPDGNGSFALLPLDSYLNNAGQLAFGAELRHPNGSSLPSGIYRGDGSSLQTIVREGQVAPDGNGLVGDILVRAYAINDFGQIAIPINLINTNGGTTDNRSICLFDDRFGLMQIARKGDAFLGSVITGVEFQSPIIEQTALNNIGQIAYQFSLADGRSGIAVATLVPEPSALLLAVLAAITSTCPRWAVNCKHGRDYRSAMVYP